MKNNDVTLIQQTLGGDQRAFTVLVEKYQKQIHAFAWRKLGDFHLAEEITQDTFLQVYQRLWTLRDPNRFAAWLHAIAKNCCLASYRKTQLPIVSLETMSEAEIEKLYYTQYVDKQSEMQADEKRHEVVKHLLSKLPETEYTVITLHYLGEMRCEDISEFLNVPLNTIKSRLHRARKRLKEEELMVRETLGGFELPENLTENIMQWIQMNEPGVAASIGTLSKTSDGTIYAVMGYKNIYKLTPEKDEWQHVNSEFFPDKTDGSIPIAEHNETLYIIPSHEMFASNDGGKTWKSVGACPKGFTRELLLTDNAFYLTHSDGVFRSKDAGKSWQNMHDGLDKRLIEKSVIRLLRLSEDTLLLGTDLGMFRNRSGTWEHLQLPVDNIVKVCSLEVTEDHIYVAAEVNILEGDGTPTQNYFNLCDSSKESWWVFRSADGGESWTDITPTDARKLLKTLPPIRLLAHENTLLLVGIEEGIVTRSIDCGDTWETIEHSGITPMKFSVNDTVTLDTDCGTGTFYTGGLAGIHRSTNGGKTWHRFNTRFPCRVDNLISLKTNPDAETSTLFATVAGTLVRSTDTGNSWTTVDVELPKYTETVPKYNAKVKGRDYTPKIVQISIANGDLYAKGIRRNSETAFYRLDPDKNCLVPVEGYIFELGKTPPSRDSARLMWTVFGNATFPFQSNRLPGQGVQITFTRSTDPDADTESLSTQVIRNDPKYGAECFLKLLDEGHSDPQTTHELMWEGLFGNFAISDETYYMEYNYKLFRWNPGDTRWSDTNVEETCELTRENMARSFKIAASGETVYVGKRDGQLFQTLDGGENWNDITSNLPKPIEHFNQIVLNNTTVHVATDKGVLNSIDGVVWHTITDEKGKGIIIKSLATAEDTVYGANDDGIYQYENKKGIWKQIVPQIPDTITSLVVDGETFFVGTEQRGVHRFERSEAQ
ncbi:sigma-70 family RNA polymerase sigma factor [Candidatus Poribacteria bacterium]|nr:sigma-70 family RNA polymerase sigma factor [Candidatus Poribacteria bacterium]MYI94672.1 sigma-70 family RNA polymerase sigma factor [Candidatus Poribacteria bacterium]